MKETIRQTLRRRSDEPKLEVGDTVPIREGVVGIVIARFRPTAKHDEIHYVVEYEIEKKRA